MQVQRGHNAGFPVSTYLRATRPFPLYYLPLLPAMLTRETCTRTAYRRREKGLGAALHGTHKSQRFGCWSVVSNGCDSNSDNECKGARKKLKRMKDGEISVF